MSHPEEIRTLARKTIDEVTRRGWGQASMAVYEDKDYETALDGRERLRPDAKSNCKVCLAGGVGAVLYGDPECADTAEAVNDPFFIVLADQVRPGWSSEVSKSEYEGLRYDSPVSVITEWNDQTERTVEEVLAALEAIAA